MELPNGKITQNGRWISYKTNLQTESINSYQELAAELRAAITKKSIKTDGDYHASISTNSTTRKGCTTIKVYSEDPAMDVFPFESHSVD